MFREMRRKNQQLPQEVSQEILKKGSFGVLAVHGDDGYPYAVPLSYVYFDGKIYFHSAKEGHKVDAVRRYEKVSFCVVEKDEISEAELTTFYRSVIVFGKAHIIEDAQEKRTAIEALTMKYCPGNMAGGLEAIKKEWDRLCMIVLEPDLITGKEAVEFMRQRKG